MLESFLTKGYLISVIVCNSEFFEDGFTYNILGVLLKESENAFYIRLRENRFTNRDIGTEGGP